MRLLLIAAWVFAAMSMFGDVAPLWALAAIVTGRALWRRSLVQVWARRLDTAAV